MAFFGRSSDYLSIVCPCFVCMYVVSNECSLLRLPDIAGKLLLYRCAWTIRLATRRSDSGKSDLTFFLVSCLLKPSLSKDVRSVESRKNG